MATLRDIRMRIKGVSNTSKITQAMKMVSAAKMKRAQNAIESARPYVQKLEEMLANLVAGLGDSYSHELIEERGDVKKIGLVIVGSDRGLAGSFNANTFKYVKAFIEKARDEYPNASIELLAVGNKMVQFYGRRTENEVVAKYRDVFGALDFSTARDIVGLVSEKFILGDYDKVFVIYNTFINILKQEPTAVQLLPIPKKKVEEGTQHHSVDYIFEPNKEDILLTLLPKMVGISMWRALLESNAAEQAARMMAMETATKNAKDLIEQLNVVYNRKRQDAITTEMMEIIGGAEALG